MLLPAPRKPESRSASHKHALALLCPVLGPEVDIPKGYLLARLEALVMMGRLLCRFIWTMSPRLQPMCRRSNPVDSQWVPNATQKTGLALMKAGIPELLRQCKVPTSFFFRTLEGSRSETSKSGSHLCGWPIVSPLTHAQMAVRAVEV